MLDSYTGKISSYLKTLHPPLSGLRTLGAGISSYLATKIFSYSENRKKFEYDYWRVIVSLRYRPRNWKFHFPYELINSTEDMNVWVANKLYGFNFSVEGRHYGGVNAGAVFFQWLIWKSWRKTVFDEAWKAGMSPNVEKYGLTWRDAEYEQVQRIVRRKTRRFGL